MAFLRHGSPEKLEVIQTPAEELRVCTKCGAVIARSSAGSKIVFGSSNVTITCACGEVNHV